MASVDMKQQLLHWASEQGFCSAGIADIGIGEELIRLHHWLNQGYQAEMVYMQKPNRGNIPELYPWAKCALVVAMRVGEPLTVDSDHFTAARYAQGRDYHRVMGDRLSHIQCNLEQTANITSKVCVDTQPVLERELARRAGLGWIGKNGMLISSLYGSHVMLGVLLISDPLPPDQPVSERCGGCERCLHVCPNQALVKPYELDARRCLSYLTLENKHSISNALWPDGHNMLFGCDLCQDCCPFNIPRTAYPLRGAACDVEEMQGHGCSWSFDEIMQILEQNVVGQLHHDRALNRVKRVQILRNLVISARRNQTERRRLHLLALSMYSDADNENDVSLLRDLVMLLADSVQ